MQKKTNITINPRRTHVAELVLNPEMGDGLIVEFDNGRRFFLDIDGKVEEWKENPDLLGKRWVPVEEKKG